LSDLVIELVISIVGEAALSRRNVAIAPPPEGGLNASLGSLSAFVAGLSLMFGGITILAMVFSPSRLPVPFFLGSSG